MTDALSGAGRDAKRPARSGKRSGIAVRLATPLRGARWRHVQSAWSRRDRARQAGRDVPIRLAPALWQSLLVMPLLTLWEGIGRLAVVITEALLPAPRRILPAPPLDAFLVVGHRGSPAREVENTLPSFERALAQGANAIETDLCITKDEEVVLWHDWDPDELVAFARQAGAELGVRCRPVVPPEGHPLRRPVCELTLDEFLSAYGYAVIGGRETVSARIPLLEDLVEWVAGRTDLKAVVLDLKIPAARADLARVAQRRLDDALKRHPCRAPFLWLSPQPSVVEELRRIAPEAPSALDIELVPGIWRDRQVTSVGPAIEAGRAAAGVGRPRFTVGGWGGYAHVVSGDLRRLAGRGAPPDAPPRLFCWTINRGTEMRRLLRLGVSAILTDRPHALRKEVGRLGV